MKTETKTALLAPVKIRDDLESLYKHEGWKVIEDFFKNKYNEAIQRLKVAKEPMRDQALIAVLDDLAKELKLGILTGNQSEIVFQQFEKKEKQNYV